MSDLTLLGLPTCDTCRKARRALEGAGHVVTFRDVRADPPGAGEWETLLAAFGDVLVNRKSATWRGLSEAERALPPAALLAAHPALMKRPVIGDGRRRTLGWTRDAQAVWLG